MNQQRQRTVIRMATVSLLLLTIIPTQAQTSAFTYQGRLGDGGIAANGTYDLQFKLFDSLAGSTQIGSTQTVSNVFVSAGIFTVSLDFGPTAFPGANRWLEIAARLTGTPSFTTLSPRQVINSSPYAIRSLNASSADGPINATTQYNLGGSRVIGLGPDSSFNNFLVGLNTGNALADGHENTFIGSGAGQATTGGGMSCAGCGPGGIALFKGSHNAFLGYQAGRSNTTGTFNSFFGAYAGGANTTTNNNSFFGSFAGVSNIGPNNSFFGSFAGATNVGGLNNAFFGNNAGASNVVGQSNAFFGSFTGSNSLGSRNSFFGASVGTSTGMGEDNSFFGFAAGNSSTGGSGNTVIGADADVGSATLNNATAIGSRARVDQSDSLVLGSIAGVNFATTSVKVGIGTTTPLATLDTRGTMLVSGNVGIATTTPQATLDVNGTALLRGGATVTGTNGDGAVVTARRPTGDPFIIIDATTVAQNAVLAFRKSNFNRWLLYADANSESGGNSGSDFKLDAYNNSGGIANYLSVTRANGNVGIGTTTPSEKLTVSGKLRLDQIDSNFGAGSVQLCRNPGNVIATCTSSSLRYKQHIAPFNGGLDLIRRLRPISFTWKMDGSLDLGLGAEDVAKVEPLLVTHNDEGEIEGVRYDRLNVILINAIKQQQQQIETLRAENAVLNTRLRSVERRMRKRTRVQPR